MIQIHYDMDETEDDENLDMNAGFGDNVIETGADLSLNDDKCTDVIVMEEVTAGCEIPSVVEEHVNIASADITDIGVRSKRRVCFRPCESRIGSKESGNDQVSGLQIDGSKKNLLVLSCALENQLCAGQSFSDNGTLRVELPQTSVPNPDEATSKEMQDKKPNLSLNDDKVIRSEETSIGKPTSPYFWSCFAIKFNQILKEFWSPEKYELFAMTLGRADSSSDRMSDSFKCLLEEIFVGHATLFPAVAETQVEQEFIQETPPDQLVKRAERSTSSVQNISQSEGSSLSPELEDAVRSWIFLMEEEGMLKLPEIVFAQKYLTKSSWAADIFMRKKNMESKRNYIVKAMKELEEPEMNKKKRSSMGQTSVGFVGLSIGKRVTRYAGEPILGCSKLGVTWSLSMYRLNRRPILGCSKLGVTWSLSMDRLNRYPLVRLPLSHDYTTEALGLASIVVRQAAGGNVVFKSFLVELLIELRDGGSDYLGKDVSKVHSSHLSMALCDLSFS
ncbi:hypothetical protein Tco_1218482 [Tanacetum coccineum]